MFYIGEPARLDLGNARFRDAIATLAAPIHAIPKDELEGEDVRQHRRAQRVRRAAVATLVALTIASIVSATLAVIQRGRAVQAETDAVDQRDRAVQAEADAVGQRDRAVQAEADAVAQRDAAIAGRLAAQSTNVSSGATDLGVLLALESIKVSDSPAGRASLAEATTGPIATTTLGSPEQAPIFGIATAGDVIVTLDETGQVSVRVGSVTSRLDAPVTSGAEDVMALSPDGRFLAATDELTGLVTLWDLTSTTPRTGSTIGTPGSLVRTFDASGAHLALTTSTSVEIWTPSGQRERTLEYAGRPAAVEWSPDGALLAVAVSDGLVDVWDTATWTELDVTRAGVRPVALQFEADSGALWFGGSAGDESGDETGALFRWRPLTAQPPERFEDPTACRTGTCLLSELVYDIDRSADGTAMVVATGAGARLWPVTAVPGDAPTVLPGPSPVYAVTADPAAGPKAFLGGGVDRRLRRWTARQPDAARDRLHSSSAFAAAAAPDGTFVVSGGVDGRVFLSDVSGRSTQLGLDTRPLDGVLDVAVDPTSRYVATSVVDATSLVAGTAEPPRLLIWDVDEQRADELAVGEAASIAYAPDGSLVVGTISGGLSALVTSATSNAPTSGSLEVWDPAQPTPRRTRDVGAAVLAVATSADGRWIATASADGTARVYDSSDLSEVRVVDLQEANWALQVTFSHDSRLLAASGDSGRITLVDLEPGDDPPVRTLQGTHAGWVRGLAFTADDRFLVSAGAEDGAVRVWDVASAEAIGSPIALGESGNDLVIGLDDRIVVATGDGGLAATFSGASLDPGTRGGIVTLPTPVESFADGCDAAGRNLTIDEWQTYRAGAPYSATCAQFPPGAAPSG